MRLSKKGDDIWKCSKCFVRFGTQLEFFTHTQRKCELIGDIYQCDICQFKTKSRTGIVSHQQKHDHEKNHIECKYCKKRKMFKSRGTFLVHVNHYHKERLFEVERIIERYDKKMQKREAEKALQNVTLPHVTSSEVPITPQIQPSFNYQISTLNSIPGQPIVHFLDVPLNTQSPQFPQFPDISQYFNLNFS